MAIVRFTGSTVVGAGEVTVYLSGTLTPATVYSDALLTPLGNPFTADVLTGAFVFYADDALAYEVQEAVAAGATPLPWSVDVTSPFLASSVYLSNAQIKALPTTPIIAVPAPGAGYGLVFLLAYLTLNRTAGAYTNIDADAFIIVAFSEADAISSYLANDATTTPVLSAVTDLLSTNATSYVTFSPYTQVVGPDASDWGNTGYTFPTPQLNTALILSCVNGGSGNFTGGNAANFGVLTTYYAVVPGL